MRPQLDPALEAVKNVNVSDPSSLLMVLLTFMCIGFFILLGTVRQQYKDGKTRDIQARIDSEKREAKYDKMREDDREFMTGTLKVLEGFRSDISSFARNQDDCKIEMGNIKKEITEIKMKLK